MNKKFFEAMAKGVVILVENLFLLIACILRSILFYMLHAVAILAPIIAEVMLCCMINDPAIAFSLVLLFFLPTLYVSSFLFQTVQSVFETLEYVSEHDGCDSLDVFSKILEEKTSHIGEVDTDDV